MNKKLKAHLKTIALIGGVFAFFGLFILLVINHLKFLAIALIVVPVFVYVYYGIYKLILLSDKALLGTGTTKG